jgi:CAAX prenyl protease-like protein
MMTAERWFGVPLQIGYPIRTAVVLLFVLVLSRGVVRLLPLNPLGSFLVGFAVFLIWIGPDILIGGYRHTWFFENSLIGFAKPSVMPALRDNIPLLAVRVAGSALLVPVIEELFWRGWMMRWLVNNNFEQVPLGTYVPAAFWITAILFASEHGSYWDVGLAAGVVYNWWMVRTRSLADCIVAHGVTNGLLAIYVIATGAWQYWP